MGAYEFIRTLCDRVNAEDVEKTPAAVRDILLVVKRRFTQVRVPLAKMEAASKHANEDGPIAYPGMKRGAGVAWQLNPNTIVTRRELSDALLEALEHRRAAFWRYQAAQMRQQVEPDPAPSDSGKVDQS